MTIIVIFGHYVKCDAIIQKKKMGIFSSPAKFTAVRSDMSYGTCWYTSLLKVVKSLSCPAMYNTHMNDVGSKMFVVYVCKMILGLRYPYIFLLLNSRLLF